jgi:hypothetical protein
LQSDLAFLQLRSDALEEAPGSRPHPNVEQIVGYASNRLSGAELRAFQDHLSHCEQCRLAVADSRAFGDDVSSSHEDTRQGTSWTWASLFRRRKLAFALAGALTVVIAAGLYESNRQPASESAPATAEPIVTVELDDGGRHLVLDGNGGLSGADDLPAEYQRMLTEALSGDLPKSPQKSARLSRPPSSLMGTDDQGNSFAVIEPVGKVISSDRPDLRWSPLKNAGSYVVEIYSQNFELIQASAPVTGTTWTPRPLRRGATYSWQVKAIKAGQEFIAPRPPQPQATFRVIDSAAADELKRVQRIYHSHLVTGLLYLHEELFDDAERELLALKMENGDSPVISRLLSDVQQMR